jgi:tRNA(Arg) A34 adenosine deaminase TadA
MKYEIPTFEYCLETGMKSLHGSIVYNNGVLVGQSTNQPQGCIFGCHVPSVHAEMKAIHIAKKCVKNFKKCVLIVVRYNREGKLVNSYPCFFCLELIKLSGIKTIYYSNESGELVKAKVKDMNIIHISTGMNRAGIDRLNYRIRF